MPSYISNRIPTGGKSRFFGAAHYGKPINDDVLIHFYEWPQANLAPPPLGGRRYTSDKNYRVDFFVGNLGQTKPFRLAQSVDIASINFDSERFLFNWVGLSATWLRPKASQYPLLRLTCTVTDGFYGPFGKELLFVFDRGWFQRPDLEIFDFHGDHNGSEQFFFSSIDAKGTLQILQEYTSGGGVDVHTTNTLEWDGRKFVLSKSRVWGMDVP